MCQVMQEVKLPEGVCNIVFGLGPSVGNAIVSHPHVPLISFTGGTVTGRRISVASAPLQKRLSLEVCMSLSYIACYCHYDIMPELSLYIIHSLRKSQLVCVCVCVCVCACVCV